jgi:hypothetical protein
VVVTVASTGAVRRAGAVLRAALIRLAVTAGLTVLACVFGSAIANAAGKDHHHTPQPPAVAFGSDVADLSTLVNGLLKGAGVGQPHHHVHLPGGVSAIQPPDDQGQDNGNGNGHKGGSLTSGSGGVVGSGSSGQGSSGQGSSQGGSSGGSDAGGDVWTGSTTVTAPVKSTPPPTPPPAPPVAPPPAHVDQVPPPASHTIEKLAVKPAESTMGRPTGFVPDLPQSPVDLPLQQPAGQPISSPSTSGSAGHDFGGGANGIAGVVPPGSGFRPSPGATTDESGAKRVSDGVPGLPSTSPD